MYVLKHITGTTTNLQRKNKITNIKLLFTKLMINNIITLYKVNCRKLTIEIFNNISFILRSNCFQYDKFLVLLKKKQNCF